MVTVTCGWCGEDVAGVSLREHNEECEPACQLCGEEYDRKADAMWHDCPEYSETPPELDRIPECERLERRERHREAAARARKRRLGLDR